MRSDRKERWMTAAAQRTVGRDGEAPRLRLEDQVLAAFLRAEAEGRPEVAEHLLRALEALCPGAAPGSPAAEAYLLLAADAVSREALSRSAPVVDRGAAAAMLPAPVGVVITCFGRARRGLIGRCDDVEQVGTAVVIRNAPPDA